MIPDEVMQFWEAEDSVPRKFADRVRLYHERFPDRDMAADYAVYCYRTVKVAGVTS